MRRAIVMLALLFLPALAWAQRSAPALPPSPSPTSNGLPLPPIGFPLPPIGFPLAPIGLPPSPVALPSSALPPQTTFDWQTGYSNSSQGRRVDRTRWENKPRSTPGHAIVYFGSPYYWLSYPPYAGTAQTPGAIAPLDSAVGTGALHLAIEPRDQLQLFVDGEYLGTMEDMVGELALHPGTRRIEIRRAGYESLMFDARIVAGRAITYRGTLTPVTASGTPTPTEPVVGPPENAKPPRPQTFYLIPGCYMGNLPPEQVQLPSGCEGRRVITYTP